MFMRKVAAAVLGVALSVSCLVAVGPAYAAQGTRAVDPELRVPADAYVIPPLLRSGDALPAAPAGVSVAVDAQGATVSDGVVTSDATTPVTATLTATLKGDGPDGADGGAVSKTFTVTVLPASARKLLGYQRTPYDGADGPLKGNDGSSAYSLHLALDGADGGAGEPAAWTPLNKNYGIMFSRTYSARKDTGTGLIDPNVFVRKDGSYGVIATRTGFQYNQATGTPDASARTSVLIATTKDFQTFEQEKNDNTVNVGETNGVNDPYAVYDSAEDRYVVGWTDDDGVRKYTTFAELDGPDSVHGDVVEGEVPRSGAVATANGIEDYVPGYAVPIGDDLADALTKRFGRVTNTGHREFDDVTVARHSDIAKADLPKQVTLDYSDGSTGALPVSWDTSTVDTGKPGVYTINGTVRQTNYDPKATGKDYTVPFAEDRADPDLYKFAWRHKVDGREVTETKYLFTATNDTNGDCRLLPDGKGNYLAIRSGDSIEALADTAGDPERTLDGATGGNKLESVLLKPGERIELGDSGRTYEMEGSFWAPEIHRIGGRLSILFAVNSLANGAEDTNTQSAIMQLRQDADGYDLDPTVAANWDTPRIITYADGRTWMGSFCDMTFLKNHAGKAYYMWAGFAISPIDESTPWKIKAASNRNDPNLVELPGKDYAWEAGGAYEGQYAIEHDGRYYVTYSARRVDGRYTLGYQSAAVNADLMDPASWSKPMTPTLFSSLVDGEWQSGPGHAAFAEGPDGELLFVYHTYSHVTRADGFNGGGKGDGTGDAVKKTNGRDAYIRRVHWGANDRLILDMTPSEELADANKTVTMNVIVEADGTTGGEGDGDGGETTAPGTPAAPDGPVVPETTEGEDGAIDRHETDNAADDVPAHGKLPATGASASGLVGVTALMAAAGIGMVVWRRRRS